VIHYGRSAAGSSQKTSRPPYGQRQLERFFQNHAQFLKGKAAPSLRARWDPCDTHCGMAIWDIWCRIAIARPRVRHEIFGTLIEGVRFAADAPLDGNGFELFVPRHEARAFCATRVAVAVAVAVAPGG